MMQQWMAQGVDVINVSAVGKGIDKIGAKSAALILESRADANFLEAVAMGFLEGLDEDDSDPFGRIDPANAIRTV